MLPAPQPPSISILATLAAVATGKAATTLPVQLDLQRTVGCLDHGNNLVVLDCQCPTNQLLEVHGHVSFCLSLDNPNVGR
jgi:hypothetical protein